MFQRVSYPDYEDYVAAGTPFQDMAAWDLDQVSLEADTHTERVLISTVSGNFFSMLGIAPAAGRLIGPADDVSGGPLAAVLSHGYWVRVLDADPSVVGRTIRVDGQPCVVLGVAPEGFTGVFKLVRVDAFMPLRVRVPAARLANRDDLSVRVLARLLPGVSLRQGQAVLDTVARRLEADHRETNEGRRVRVYSQRLASSEPQSADMTVALSVFLIALVGIVLLIACGNVLGLFLARGLQRQREMAIRAALGATRWQLARLCLAEAWVIAAAGAVVGAVGGVAFVRRAASAAAPPGFPLYVDVHMNWHVFAYVAGTLFVSAAVIGMAPAWRASHIGPGEDLYGARGTATPRRQRARAALTIAQLAGSVAMLVVCGLFMRSLGYLESAELGFDRAKIVLATVDPTSAGYDEVQTRAFYQRVASDIDVLPGVAGVAQALSVPFGNSGSTARVAAEVDAAPTSVTGLLADRYVVSANYFETMGTSMVGGRSFSTADSAESPAVAIVNAQMAQTLWPGDIVVGRRFRESANGGRLVEVIGVVANARYRLDEIGGAAVPRYFLSVDQIFQPTRVLHVRVPRGVTPQMVSAIQSAVARVDPSVPVSDVFSLDHQVRFGSAGFGGTRGLSVVTGILGGIALLMALVGTYGLLSFSVAQRQREFGIRLALGARPVQIVGVVIRQWAVLIVAGLAGGLVFAAAGASALRALLFGVSPLDMVAFLGVALTFGVVALVAAALPVWRATRIDPLTMLRAD